jgi:hypothetical protein
MSELESLFSAAAPVSNSVAGDRAGSKRAATMVEKVHLVQKFPLTLTLIPNNVI